MTKKNPNKFTIGFKKNNVSHQKVVEILNNTEDKADFIASAVLHYLGEGKGTDSLNPDKSSLLPLIRTIVKKEIQEAISEKKFVSTEKTNLDETVMDLSGSEEEPIAFDEHIIKYLKCIGCIPRYIEKKQPLIGLLRILSKSFSIHKSFITGS